MGRHITINTSKNETTIDPQHAVVFIKNNINLCPVTILQGVEGQTVTICVLKKSLPVMVRTLRGSFVSAGSVVLTYKGMDWTGDALWFADTQQDVISASDARSAAASADASVIAVGTGSSVRVYRRDETLHWSLDTTISGDALADFGASVAVSDDGSVVVIGGPNDCSGIGAVWVWTGGALVKLVGQGYTSSSIGVRMGASVAVSRDGRTVVFGGPNDKVGEGSAWVWAYDGAWTQTARLQGWPGGPAVGPSRMGYGVGVDGVVVVGGPGDDSNRGAVWTYGLDGTPVGKLTATAGVSRNAGWAVATDGSTIIAGAPDATDHASVGETLVWKDGVLTRLVGAPTTGELPGQGRGVAVSDGVIYTLGCNEATGTGGVWMWSRADMQPLATNGAVTGNPLGDYRNIASSRDGRTVLLTGNAALRVYV